MKLTQFLRSVKECVGHKGPHCEIALTSRVRLARNLDTLPFPGRSDEEKRTKARDILLPAVLRLRPMADAYSENMERLSEMEKRLLVERHLISREHESGKAGSAVVLSGDEEISVMINEEDHLRMQVILPGLQLQEAWQRMDVFDSLLEKQVQYAFSDQQGYLTACPTNLGTGIRVSAMLHLPGLVLDESINKVINSANRHGMAVRGLYGEGTEAQGHIFQVSNQKTLGNSETEIVEKLRKLVMQIIEQEGNARQKMMETKPEKLLDHICRAYGILSNAYVITSHEAKNHLSMLWLGVDLELFPTQFRTLIDELFLATEPAHIQNRFREGTKVEKRDVLRAKLLRQHLTDSVRPRRNDSDSDSGAGDQA